MIKLELYPILLDNRESLRETSKDDSDPNDIQYMTSSETEVVNFDLVKRHYVNGFGLSENAITSVDAIVPLEDRILFVEFKNGQVNNRNIKDKARDSLLVFLEIIGENIAFSRSNIDFIVVYNLEKNPLPRQVQKGQLQETPSRVSIADHFMGKARKEFICFDLERYERLYYRNRNEVVPLSRDTSQSNYRRGIMSLVILSLLKSENMYGYQLCQEISRFSGGKLTIQEGSLYPILYRLQDQGLISEERVLVGKRMTRNYYHLEPSGVERLREMTAEYEELTAGVFAIIHREETIS